jgi:hypothetical protein
LQRVSHAALIENKRLGEVLAWIKHSSRISSPAIVETWSVPGDQIRKPA